MKQAMTVQIVLAALRVHPGRSVSRAELAAWANCPERQIRTAISDLRRQGWLVVGDASGYWIALTVEEVQQTVTTLERQIRSLEEVIAAMRTAALSRFGISGYPPCRATKVATTSGIGNAGYPPTAGGLVQLEEPCQ